MTAGGNWVETAVGAARGALREVTSDGAGALYRDSLPQEVARG